MLLLRSDYRRCKAIWSLLCFHANLKIFCSSSVKSCCFSVAESYPIFCDPVDYSFPGSLSFTIPQSLFRLISIELVMLSYYLIIITVSHYCNQKDTMISVLNLLRTIWSVIQSVLENIPHMLKKNVYSAVCKMESSG